MTLKESLSAAFQKTLGEKSDECESSQWVKENKYAINAYNDFVEKNGLLADEYRNF